MNQRLILQSVKDSNQRIRNRQHITRAQSQLLFHTSVHQRWRVRQKLKTTNHLIKLLLACCNIPLVHFINSSNTSRNSPKHLIRRFNNIAIIVPLQITTLQYLQRVHRQPRLKPHMRNRFLPYLSMLLPVQHIRGGSLLQVFVNQHLFNSILDFFNTWNALTKLLLQNLNNFVSNRISKFSLSLFVASNAFWTALRIFSLLKRTTVPSLFLTFLIIKQSSQKRTLNTFLHAQQHNSKTSLQEFINPASFLGPCSSTSLTKQSGQAKKR